MQQVVNKGNNTIVCLLPLYTSLYIDNVRILEYSATAIIDLDPPTNDLL